MLSPLTFPHRADDHASRDRGHYRYLLPRAETSLPADVKVALQRAWEREEQVLAKVQLAAMLENVRLAAELQRPICQDTGLPLFFLQLSRCEVFTLSELETGIRFGARPPGGSLQKGRGGLSRQVPAVEEKIVQMALKRILEAIYEVDFCDVMFPTDFDPIAGATMRGIWWIQPS
jgi:hypothetical protein